MSQYMQLVFQATNYYPNECCGLLVGNGEEQVILEEIVESPNLFSSRKKFLIDPQIQFDCLRELRGTFNRIIGNYHSHPSGLALPSYYDKEMAIELDQIWLIISVVKDLSFSISAYQVCSRKGNMIPLEINITPGKRIA